MANAANGAVLTLQSDTQGAGTGTVSFGNAITVSLTGSKAAVDIYHNPASFGTPTDFAANVTAGQLTNYQLVNNLTNLQAAGSYLNQNFALGRDIDASDTANWNGGLGFVPIGGYTAFSGNFDGLGHVITNLTINRPTENTIGLFGLVGGPAFAPGIFIRNVGLINAQITGQTSVGGLIGQTGNCGFCGALTVSNSFVTGKVSGLDGVGGLIGGSGQTTIVRDSHSAATVFGTGNKIGGLIGSAYWAQIIQSFATGTVTGSANSIDVGGLVGWHDYGSIVKSYATGTVTSGINSQNVGGLTGTNWVYVGESYALGDVTAGAGSTNIGGLVGHNIGPGYGNIEFSYASGAVNGAGSTNVGGFAGFNEGAVISNSYWDSYSTGQATASGSDTGTVTNLLAVTSDPGQTGAANYAFNPAAYANFNPASWTYFKTATRPIGSWEAPRTGPHGTTQIGSAHQLQFVNNDLFGNYRLLHDIDLGETGRLSGIWGTAGLFVLGDFRQAFAGNFDGAGHILSNLTIANRPGTLDTGLFGRNDGFIRDLGLFNATITGANGYTGALAGYNNGTISGSFSTGSVTAPGSSTGGLVGLNANLGLITQSYSTATVAGNNYAGGLVGANAGSVSFSYASGAVSGTNTGGLAGSNEPLATLSDSYWDKQSSGVAAMCGVDNGTNCSNAAGLTSAQAAQASSYTGWSIDSVGQQNAIWRVYNGQSAPLLKSFLKPLTLSPVNTTATYSGSVPNIFALPAWADPAQILGTATLTGGGANVGTYNVSYAGGLYSGQLGYDMVASAVPATLTITPKAITVAANDAGRNYGDANPVFTYNATGLIGGDTLAGSLSSSANNLSNIGVYAITQGSLANSNYAISFTGGNLMVLARPLSVTADTLTRLYGDANPALSYTASGLVNGDALIGGLTTTAVLTSNVGTYSVNQGSLSASTNYALSFFGSNLSVTARPLTVTADTLTRLYGDANPALTFTSAGLVSGDSLSGGLTTLANATSNVGAFSVDQGTLMASTNYALSFVGANLSVTARPLTVTADTLTRLYGDANPALTYTSAGLVNGDSLSGGLTTLANGTSNVGAYGISQGTLAASTNYALSYTSANLSVTPRPLTVTADTLTRLYGDANPSLTYTSAGLINGDTLTGGLTTLANSTSNIGNYAINQGSLANTNYVISYTGANLSITARPLTVTADTLTRLYGDANPALTYTSLGLVNGDTLTGGLTTLAGTTSNVGAYAVNQGTLAASTNYALSYTGVNLSVTARPLTVTADTLTRLYGDANPALTYSSLGLVNGDSLNGGLTTLAGATSNVGAYAIGQGTLAASTNYALSYTGANLSVTARPLTVTADTLTRLYGDANPALTYTSLGLVNGDTVTGSLTTLAGLTANVGTYAISQGTLAASTNYALSYAGANLSVTARPLTVTADPLTRLYGDANPALTYTSLGLANGDTLTGGLATMAGSTSNVGSYAINQGSLVASTNYALSFSGANLSVTARPLTVAADTLTRLYGDANPALTYTSLGLVNGDTVTGSLTTAANATSNVGNYAIQQGTLAASANYSLTYSAANLGISARALAVTANAFSRVYGDANPALTYNSTGLVNGDSLTGGLATAAGLTANVGIYAIHQGTLLATPNYALSFTAANLTVTARPISVMADALNRRIGDPNPALTYTIGGAGLAGGDSLTGALATSATGSSGNGPYPITQGSLAATTNYNLTYTGADLTISFCVAGLTCAAPAAIMEVSSQIGSAVQDQADPPTEEQQEEAAAAASAANPKVMISSVIDMSNVNQTIPVNEPVTGAGNSTLWLPGAPQ
jgi:hypothetical protein